MNGKIAFVLLISVFFAFPAFADYSELELKMPEFVFAPYYAVTIPGEEESSIHQSIRNNEFFLESLRLNRLALDTFQLGDYDASAGFAEEAIRYAQRSDEHVSIKLIAEAKRLLDWAGSSNIAARYPNNFALSKTHYETAVAAHSKEEWADAIDSSIKAIEILSVLELESGGSPSSLPRQYTVRTWAVERDCLWNIAGYPWVYGNPWMWPELYEANKSKMPDPGNPDLIEPGMVLDIPSIRSEARQGMWDPNRAYVTP